MVQRDIEQNHRGSQSDRRCDCIWRNAERGFKKFFHSRFILYANYYWKGESVSSTILIQLIFDAVRNELNLTDYLASVERFLQLNDVSIMGIISSRSYFCECHHQISWLPAYLKKCIFLGKIWKGQDYHKQPPGFFGNVNLFFLVENPSNQKKK